MLNKIAVLGLGVFFSINASASDAVLVDDLPIQWASIITVTGGVAWATAGQNLYLYPYAIPDYQYYAFNSDTSTAGTAEIFFGLQRMVAPQVIGELGLGIAGVSDMTVSGTVTVNGIPDAYNYAYKVNHGRLELKGRLIANYFQPVQPYISGSFGVAFNNSHDYRPVYNNPIAPQPLWYDSNVTVAFPYSVGAGIQAALNPNWQVAVGYQFADLGKSYLNGDGVLLDKGLRLTHLYTNELLVSLSYLFS